MGAEASNHFLAIWPSTTPPSAKTQAQAPSAAQFRRKTWPTPRSFRSTTATSAPTLPRGAEPCGAWITIWQFKATTSFRTSHRSRAAHFGANIMASRYKTTHSRPTAQRRAAQSNSCNWVNYLALAAVPLYRPIWLRTWTHSHQIQLPTKEVMPRQFRPRSRRRKSKTATALRYLWPATPSTSRAARLWAYNFRCSTKLGCKSAAW